jgi:hypothetical protein
MIYFSSDLVASASQARKLPVAKSHTRKAPRNAATILVLHVFEDRSPGHENETHGDDEDNPAIQRLLQERPVFDLIEHFESPKIKVKKGR